MQNDQHTLIYDGYEFDVDHPEGCNTQYDSPVNCGVRHEFECNGIDSYFTDDADELSGYYDPTLITVPGRYLIEYWEERSCHYEYGYEYSSGVQLVYPEEVKNG